MPAANWNPALTHWLASQGWDLDTEASAARREALAGLPADAVEALGPFVPPSPQACQLVLGGTELELQSSPTRLERHAWTGGSVGEALGLSGTNEAPLDSEALCEFTTVTIGSTSIDDDLVLVLDGPEHGHVYMWDRAHGSAYRAAWSFSGLWSRLEVVVDGAAHRAPAPASSPERSPLPNISDEEYGRLRSAGLGIICDCAFADLRPPVEESTLERLEGEIGEAIPEQLRALWSQMSGGTALFRDDGHASDRRRLGRVIVPVDIGDPRHWPVVDAGLNLVPWGTPATGPFNAFIPFAHGDGPLACVYYVCLVRADYGAIYRATWGRAVGEDSTDRIERVADDLQSYLCSLRWADAGPHEDGSHPDRAREDLDATCRRLDDQDLCERALAAVRDLGSRGRQAATPPQVVAEANHQLLFALRDELGEPRSVVTPAGGPSWLQIYVFASDDGEAVKLVTSGLRVRPSRSGRPPGELLLVLPSSGEGVGPEDWPVRWLASAAQSIASRDLGLPTVLREMPIPAGPFLDAAVVVARTLDEPRVAWGGEVTQLWAVCPISDYEAEFGSSRGTEQILLALGDGVSSLDFEAFDPERKTLARPRSGQRAPKRVAQNIRQWMESVVHRLVDDEHLLLTHKGTQRTGEVVDTLVRVVEAGERRDAQICVPPVCEALIEAEDLVEDLFCDDDTVFDVIEGERGSVRLPVVPTPARLAERQRRRTEFNRR